MIWKGISSIGRDPQYWLADFGPVEYSTGLKHVKPTIENRKNHDFLKHPKNRSKMVLVPIPGAKQL